MSRFTNRTPTIQEMVWVHESMTYLGDALAVLPSMLALLRSRRVDPSWDPGEESMAVLGELLREMLASMQESWALNKVSGIPDLTDLMGSGE